MPLTTRSGDSGETSLNTSDRVRKDNPVVEALGAGEELNARLGLAKLHMDRFKETVTRFQRSIVQIMAVISSMGRAKYNDLDKENNFLDVLVEEYGRDIGVELKGFVIPGTDIPSAEFHVARASCRQFERRVVSLQDLFALEPNILRYINRLSDVLYLMAVITAKGAPEED